MPLKIVVVEFQSSTKQYEYLFDDSMYVPANNDLAIFGSSHAVVQENHYGDRNTAISKNKLDEYKVVKIVGIKEITNQEYAGRLRPIVCLFSIDWFLQQTAKQQRLNVLRQNLEQAAKNVSVITQLEAMGAAISPETKQMLEEYKKLI